MEACRVWLLKQKQTQDWKTTKATADAMYSLLLRGKNLLASDALVRVTFGRRGDRAEARSRREPAITSSGSSRREINPAMGSVTVTKTDPGVAWGSVHWQYLEDMSRVTPHEGTPLTLRKQLFIKESTTRGPVLKAVEGPVSVGDELVVRVELRVDRDMEYVHLKDQRGSGLEPVNVLSEYRFQDGLGLLRVDPRHGQPLLHRLSAQGNICLRILHPRRASRRSTSRGWRRSSACTLRSSTVTARVS